MLLCATESAYFIDSSLFNNTRIPTFSATTIILKMWESECSILCGKHNNFANHQRGIRILLRWVLIINKIFYGWVLFVLGMVVIVKEYLREYEMLLNIPNSERSHRFYKSTNLIEFDFQNWLYFKHLIGKEHFNSKRPILRIGEFD